jgi:hypothetical protein
LNANQRYVEDKLNPVEEAKFDSYADEHEARCHPDTRVDLLCKIDRWADDPEGKRVLWLQGMAGTGKSTISRTVAHNFATKGRRLGASFFFKKSRADRGNAARFFTTIAAHLVCQLPPLAQHVRSAIDAHSGITTKTTKEQFEKLILQPLNKIHSNSKKDLKTVVIVVDALDECGEEDIEAVLQNLADIKEVNSVRLRVFLTSRREPTLVRIFQKRLADAYQEFSLHDIDEKDIERDISIFLQDTLLKIREDRMNTDNLDPEWPGKERTDRLKKESGKLFIYAATACRFLRSSPEGYLEQYLSILLEENGTRDQRKGGKSDIHHLDELYETVLKSSLDPVVARIKPEYEQKMIRILGSISVLADLVPAGTLAKLLWGMLEGEVTEKDVANTLRPLYAVVYIPQEPDSSIQLIHLSFRDFLVNSDKRAKDFWVDEKETHRKLAIRCLQLLDENLTKDICRLLKPGKLRRNIDKQTILEYLPLEVQYACRHWVYHLKGSEIKVQDEDQAHQFLKRHFLHWLEALSVIGRVSESVGMIDELQSMTDVSYPAILYPNL